MPQPRTDKPRGALTPGDPAGIRPEIALKAARDPVGAAAATGD